MKGEAEGALLFFLFEKNNLNNAYHKMVSFTIKLNTFCSHIACTTRIYYVIKKSGIYGITFNTNLASGVTAEFEIYANTRLIASVSNPPGSTLAKVAKIVAQLEKNEVLQVKTTVTINLFDANLTAAKLD